MPEVMRRIVTGHDDAGNAIIVSDAPPERVQRVGEHGPVGVGRQLHLGIDPHAWRERHRPLGAPSP